MSAQTTRSTATAMELPVVYVEPGQLLAEVFVYMEGWRALGDMMQAVVGIKAQPRLAYAYRMPESNRLLAKIVLNMTATRADEAALLGTLSAVPGLEVISVQAPTEAGLVMSERQRPELAGTPAVIFGRPVIGSLAHGIIETQGETGERLLSELGHDAGQLAASALPPLIEQLGMTISGDLLTRRMRDLQVMLAGPDEASAGSGCPGRPAFGEAGRWVLPDGRHADRPSLTCDRSTSSVARKPCTVRLMTDHPRVVSRVTH